MANRVMKQKANKARRQRRAWAKEYSRSSGMTVNRGVLQEYKERACGLGVSEYEVDELIRTLYGREPILGVSPRRKEVMDLLKRLKKIVPQMLFVEIHDNSVQRTVLFFNSTKTCWVVGHTNKKVGMTSTSIEYGSKERALSQFYSNKTVWVSCHPSDQVPAPP